MVQNRKVKKNYFITLLLKDRAISILMLCVITVGGIFLMDPPRDGL